MAAEALQAANKMASYLAPSIEDKAAAVTVQTATTLAPSAAPLVAAASPAEAAAEGNAGAAKATPAGPAALSTPLAHAGAPAAADFTTEEHVATPAPSASPAAAAPGPAAAATDAPVSALRRPATEPTDAAPCTPPKALKMVKAASAKAVVEGSAAGAPTATDKLHAASATAGGVSTMAQETFSDRATRILGDEF